MLIYKKSAVVALATLIALNGGTALGAHVSVTVDCGLAETINGKIDTLVAGEYPDKLTFKGTCKESVEIRRNGFELVGDPGGATLTGHIWVLGAQDIDLADFKVKALNEAVGIGVYNGGHARLKKITVFPKGPNHTPGTGIEIANNSMATFSRVISKGAVVGVRVFGNSYLRVRTPSKFVNNTDAGLQVRMSSAARLTKVTISGNVNQGIGAFDSSSVDMDNSSVTNNNIGIWLSRSSSLRLTDNEIATTSADSDTIGAEVSSSVDLNGGNSISAIGANTYAIDIRMSSALIGRSKNGMGSDTITASGAGGLALWLTQNSSSELRRFDITGGVTIQNGSVMKLRNRTGVAGATMITGNVTITQDSALRAVNGSLDDIFTIDGDLTCNDIESSYTDGGAVTVTGTTSCTGF